MLRFKQFIKENPDTHYGEAGGYLDDKTLSKPSDKYDEEEHLGGGLYARRFKADGSKPYMYRQEDEQGKNIHHVRGTRVNGVFVVRSSSKASWAGPQANFYRDILDHENRIKSDYVQTAGGQKTWYDLAHNHPDVEVTHHNEFTGAKIKLHKGDDWGKNFDGPQGRQGRTSFIARLKRKNKP